MIVERTYCDDDDDLNIDTEPFNRSTTSRPSNRLAAYSELLSEYNIRSTPHQAHFLSHLTVNSVRYTTRSKHEGNSNILVGENDEEVPVSIIQILQFPGHPDAWVLVRAYRDVSVKNDPFRGFPPPSREVVQSVAL